MSKDFWLDRWRENRIGFHRAETNPLLQQFLPAAAGETGRVLVPLCGKSLDIAWLAARGYDVVGVELSELAARSFAAEQGLTGTFIDRPPFKVLQAAGLAIYVGDFFEFTAATAGRFNLIYDRAALIALPAELRAAYAARLLSLLDPGGRILLIGLEYDRQQMAGPPFSVAEPEVRRLFAGQQIDKLYEHDCLEEEAHFRERGLTWMKESVYRIHAPERND